MSIGKSTCISLLSAVILLGSFPLKSNAGALSFIKRHVFGSSKSQTKTPQTKASNGLRHKTAAMTKAGHPFNANASWYGGKFNGRRTASGQVFDESRLTAASRTLPLGTKVLVQNPATGKSCTVVINDRGPFVAGRDLDLSRAAAQKIGVTGVSPVVCIADTSAVTLGDYKSGGGGLLRVPGKVMHLLAGII